MILNRRKLYEAEEKNPKAKIRNRGDVVFPADSSLVNDDADHFPINSEAQARNALARANQYKKVPDWYNGSLKKLVTTVANNVHKKYPSIDISKAARIPGKGPVNEGYLNESNGYNKIEVVREALGDNKLLDEIINYLDDGMLLDIADYITKNHNLDYDNEEEEINIIEYLKEEKGWDDLSDVQIKDIGDIINDAADDNEISTKLSLYLDKIGNDNHTPDELLDDFTYTIQLSNFMD